MAQVVVVATEEEVTVAVEMAAVKVQEATVGVVTEVTAKATVMAVAVRVVVKVGGRVGAELEAERAVAMGVVVKVAWAAAAIRVEARVAGARAAALVVALGGSGVRAAGTCLHRRRSTGRWAREKPTCTCEDKRVVRAGSALSMPGYL